ncbi:hypothetical protein LYSHEL_26560 [Lysobacter helvus]|uniref:Uncharacterized protein n=2 Tax=Lysobacteraceae TaxID=32033 RepID=A0ABN6FVY9_9GAMM|nr:MULTISPECIES: hypothetical protein [Lysobacter]BCT93631.1 hypothetical protein LYSCAS_26550 [Lysobacter caseinilyticus]BCT96785.1 hypothetical protein LYSHEL_26560 [Lysobacter helvus]
MFEGKGGWCASLIMAALVSGCMASSHRVAPGQVGVEVEAPDVPCDAGHRDIAVKVHVRNDSRGTLRFWIRHVAGAPDALSWLSYAVLDSAGNAAAQHGAGAHGPLPQPTLTMAPGNRTVLSATLYDIGEAEYARRFRLRVEDQDEHSWTTAAFRPCVQPE